MKRQEILAQAGEIIDGSRQELYGDPAASFGRAAKIWSAILGIEISPSQVAMCLAGVKLSRLAHVHDHVDSWVDLAGYAALGGEVATATEQTES